MLYGHYVLFVQERAGIETSAAAEEAIHAVFEVLDEAVPRTMAEELAETVPIGIRDQMGKSIWTLRFNRDEFIDRVAQKESVDRTNAEKHVRAVLSVLVEYLPSIELLKILDVLPTEVRRLFRPMPMAA